MLFAVVSAGPYVGLFYHVLEGEHLDFRDTIPLTLVKAWAPGAAGMREALKSRHGVLEKYDCQLFYAQGGEGQGRSRGEGEFSELTSSAKSEPDIIYIKAIPKSSSKLRSMVSSRLCPIVQIGQYLHQQWC